MLTPSQAAPVALTVPLLMSPRYWVACLPVICWVGPVHVPVVGLVVLVVVVDELEVVDVEDVLDVEELLELVVVDGGTPPVRVGAVPGSDCPPVVGRNAQS